jgi:hypothetical protein
MCIRSTQIDSEEQKKYFVLQKGSTSTSNGEEERKMTVSRYGRRRKEANYCIISKSHLHTIALSLHRRVRGGEITRTSTRESEKKIARIICKECEMD